MLNRFSSQLFARDRTRLGDVSDPAPHACQSLSPGGYDPKLVADQLGHGLGVNLDVYTVPRLDKRQEAVQALEASLVRS